MASPASSESIAPKKNVVFEIPLEKKHNSSPNSIQKRLAAQAHTPTKETTLKSIENKLSEANKRKEANGTIAKTASHNDRVQNVREMVNQIDTEKKMQLEKQISTKLEKADCKRETTNTGLLSKLSQAAKDKLKRANKVRDAEEWNSKELEAQSDIKLMKAELRRNEDKLQLQEKLAVSTHDKMKRGQLALSMAELEKKRIENQSEQKLLSAGHRKEMQQILKSSQLADVSGKKMEKAGVARKQEEADASKRRAEIEVKLALANERKEKAISEKINESIMRSATKKERLLDIQKQEEKEAKVKLQAIHKRVEAASLRKEEIFENQRARIVAKTQQDEMNAKASWLESLNEEIKLKESQKRKLTLAAERKHQLMEDLRIGVQDANQLKLDKIDEANKRREQEETKKFGEIEQKLKLAAVNREMLSKTKSASKKRPLSLSPRVSPTDKNAIETKIDQANMRREIYLSKKVEKAKSSSPKINKALFASVSPMRKNSPGDSRDSLSPRIKAARLEEFHSNSDEDYSNNQGDNSDDNGNHMNGFNVPLMVIGGIAAVLVGLLSFSTSLKK